MKLIVTIVSNQDGEKIIAALTSQRIGVTRVSSTGGLITPGNTTLLIGVDDDLVPQVTQVITTIAALRSEVVPYDHVGNVPFRSFMEVEVGGFISFVLDIDHFEQV